MERSTDRPLSNGPHNLVADKMSPQAQDRLGQGRASIGASPIGPLITRAPNIDHSRLRIHGSSRSIRSSSVFSSTSPSIMRTTTMTTTACSVGSAVTFRRRPRHKTRPDKYSYAHKKRHQHEHVPRHKHRPVETRNERKRKKKSINKGIEKRRHGAGPTGLVQLFQAKNISRSRITVGNVKTNRRMLL